MTKNTLKNLLITLITVLTIIAFTVAFSFIQNNKNISGSNVLANKINNGAQKNSPNNHLRNKNNSKTPTIICKYPAKIENIFKRLTNNIDKSDEKSKKVLTSIMHDSAIGKKIKLNGSNNQKIKELFMHNSYIDKLSLSNDECGANAASWLANIFSNVGDTEKANKYHKIVLNFAKKGNQDAIRNICIGAVLSATVDDRVHFCETIFDTPKIKYDSQTTFTAYKFLSTHYFDTNQVNKLINFCEKNHNRKEVCYYSFMFPSVNRLAAKLYDNKNYEQAIYLYEKSAPYDESKRIHAILGIMYLYGMGTEKDPKKSISWFNSSLTNKTLQNEQEALIRFMVGTAYEQQNKYVEAFQSYKKGAILGDALCQFHLARQYALGHGTIQDYKEAYAWISISIAQGLNDKETQNKAEEFQTWFKESLQEQDKKGIELTESQTLAKKYYQLYVLQKNDTE
ncbi:TPA: tetratricopeptide repeat protein [Legionella pneumophila]